MSGSTRFAVVGCGVIGALHARVVADSPGLEVTALVDVVPERADALAHTLQARGARRPQVAAGLTDDLLDGVDAVAVCVPSGLHAGLAVRVLAAGRHLVVEKPADVSVAAARRIVAAADAASAGTVATVISQHRFDPASRAVADAVRAGELGRLTSAVATVPWWRGQDYYDSGQWRGTRELDGGGALMNQGIHTVDLLLWLLGRPVEVAAATARLAHTGIEVEDTAAAVLRFASGALATLHATTAARPGLTVRLQVTGDRGSAVLDNDRLYYFHSAAAQPSGAATRGVGGGDDQSADRVPAGEHGRVVGGGPGTGAMVAGHTRQYADIARAIRGGGTPGVTPRDGLLAVATVLAVYRAAETGSWVRVADVLADAADPTEPDEPDEPDEPGPGRTL